MANKRAAKATPPPKPKTPERKPRTPREPIPRKGLLPPYLDAEQKKRTTARSTRKILEEQVHPKTPAVGPFDRTAHRVPSAPQDEPAKLSGFLIWRKP